MQGQVLRSSSSASKAGLQFPVARLNRYLRKGKYASRVGVGAGVYMGAVLEYLCAETRARGNAARGQEDAHRARHIQLAVRTTRSSTSSWARSRSRPAVFSRTSTPRFSPRSGVQEVSVSLLTSAAAPTSAPTSSYPVFTKTTLLPKLIRDDLTRPSPRACASGPGVLDTPRGVHPAVWGNTRGWGTPVPPVVHPADPAH